MFEVEYYIVELPVVMTPKYKHKSAIDKGHIAIKDNGCKNHPDCLTCPLPECTLDHIGRPPKIRGVSSPASKSYTPTR